jgi:hypothetical protein
MRRKWLLVLGLLIVTVTALAIVIVRTPRFQKWYRPPVFVLPAADEVAEMRASLNHREFTDGPPVPEFVVPAEHVPAILAELQPAESLRDFSAKQFEFYGQMGEITIRTKAGGVVHLRWCWWGKNPVAFTPNGEDYFLGRRVDENGHLVGDGGMRLYSVVQKAREVARR